MKVPDKIPEWLAMLPKDALLDTKDIASIFGYKNSMSAAGSIGVYHPEFPKADHTGKFKVDLKSDKEYWTGHHRTLRWKAMTIRNFIRQYNRGELK